MLKGARPDITPAQIIALLVAAVPVVATLLRAFGVYDLTVVQTAALTETLQWAAVVAGALFVSDAGLRAARNAAEAKTVAAVTTASDPQGAAQAAGLATGPAVPASDPETGLSEVEDPEVEAFAASDAAQSAELSDELEFSDPTARAVAEEVARDREG
jgi:hypothetical protein